MSLTKEFFERETNITAKVICDSISESGNRITTLEIEYPRFILAELNTHKMLEKNSSSSRAIPIIRMIDQIETNMAMPLYWGKAKSGMQADGEVDPATRLMAECSWRGDFHRVKESAIWMDDMFIHKQIANRLLEPFQMMKTVITGTDWDNFFNLRIHPDAQPEFCMLAYKMYQAMKESTPKKLLAGQWHLPYVDVVYSSEGRQIFVQYSEENPDQIIRELSLEEAQRISASCTAQTSYRKSDDSLEKADKVFNMLVHADVLHASPFGHLATPVPDTKDMCYFSKYSMLMHPSHGFEGVTHINRKGKFCSGNLTGWISYRHLIPNNTCYNFNFEERMKLFDN